MQVLVAHHDRWTRLVLSDALVHEGFRVAEASNGMAALRLVEQARPDVVVLGPELSEMASSEVRSAIKSNPRTRGIGVFVVRQVARPVVSAVAAYRTVCRRRRRRVDGRRSTVVSRRRSAVSSQQSADVSVRR
jgi:chemotaxis response regulator CheB